MFEYFGHLCSYIDEVIILQVIISITFIGDKVMLPWLVLAETLISDSYWDIKFK